MSIFDAPHSLIAIAFAGLALSLGAKEDELDSIYDLLQRQSLPETPGEAAMQVRIAIEECLS